MKRREFLLKSALGASATVAFEGCGDKEERLIPLLVPEEELIPGTEYWTPSVCGQCPAGCGILVKTMLGEAATIVQGKPARVKVRQAKKIEGNPDHPLNRGKLCARGQAGLNVLYNPDRLHGPLKRTGTRGSGQYKEISWEDALTAVITQLRDLNERNDGHKLLFFSGDLPGHRQVLVERFLRAFGSPNHFVHELFSDQMVQHANLLTSGEKALAGYDVENAHYVISFGASFLETWRSPVHFSLGFGNLRQGQSGFRGKLVQVEPRLSLTAANADEWLPVTPGTEGVLAMGLANVILREDLHDREFVQARCRNFDDFREVAVAEYGPQTVSEVTGLAGDKIVRIAREFARHRPALVLCGDSATAHSNGVFTAAAAHALNALMGNLGQPGGMSFAPTLPFAQLPELPRSLVVQSGQDYPALGQENGSPNITKLAEQLNSGQPYSIDVLFLYESNPLYSLPASLRFQEALEKIPLVVSFSNFMDESTAMSDLILPDHTFLESWWDSIPDPMVAGLTVGLAQPVLNPIFNTRSTPDVLLEVARALGEDWQTAFPWDNFEELLRHAWQGLHRVGASDDKFASFWEEVLASGKWHRESSEYEQEFFFDFSPAISTSREPVFSGAKAEFPFYLHLYQSLTLSDGRGANQPWMQELPDPMTTVSWGSWVEINPKTAQEFGIEEGNLVRVESPHGELQGPALLYPGARPDTVGIPAGQGHLSYGRYAKSRGANPMDLLAPVVEPTSGALAWSSTRVKLSKVVGSLELIKIGDTEVSGAG